MKYLSKIIFINSAGIDYGEVCLDGNIHFTGTQGVGKSTLLRAILFFYNADKAHLGIRPQGQKPFDEFYLPKLDSYIIYEVTTAPDRVYSVILFRNQGKAAFRFVDSPFCKEWIVDSNGEVADDQLSVRSNITKTGAEFSPIIDRYEKYRDIIYGNRHADLKAEMLKYRIMESLQCNIPKIITNVFLNERVDADFIKDTMIRSITDDNELSFDLDYFRSRLENFTYEYNDVQLWSKLNRQGRCETADRAVVMIERLHKYLADDVALHTSCAELAYAVSVAKSLIPVLKEKISGVETKVGNIKDKINDLDSRYSKSHDKLIGEISVLEEKLSRCRRKQREYRQKEIEKIIQLMASENDVIMKRRQAETELARLQSDYSDITAHYQSLIDGVKAESNAYLQNRRAEAISRKEDSMNKIASLRDDRDNARREVEADFADRQSNLRILIDEAAAARHSLQLKEYEIRASKPKANEISASESELLTLSERQKELEGSIREREWRLEQLKKDTELRISHAEAEWEKVLNTVRLEITRLNSEIESEQDLLSRFAGSLCEWLDSNVDGWEDTIGKIADEKNVLYNTSLSPCKSSGGHDSLFGVEIDLDCLERQIRTPRELECSILSLQTSLSELKTKEASIISEKENEISGMKSKARNTVRELVSQNETDRATIAIVGQQMKNKTLELEKLRESQEKIIDDLLAGNSRKLEEVTLEQEKRKEDLRKLDAELRTRIAEVNRKFKKREENERAELERFEESVELSIGQNQEQSKSKIKKIEALLSAGLTEAGADLSLIEECKKRIKEFDSVFAAISGSREFYYSYLKDCRELFDLEPETKAKCEKLKSDLESLQASFNQKRANLNSEYNNMVATLAELRENLKSTSGGLDRANEFCEGQSCPEYFKEQTPVTTQKQCGEILRQIIDLIQASRRDLNELKESVNAFRQPFSDKNTFKFPPSPITDADYCDYARSVDEFVSENKIEHFRNLTNDMYINLLERVESDYSILSDKEGEIRKLVNDMNFDFEKKTFAGVIRQIKLKIEESRNPFALLLKEICAFREENSYNLGQLNLFSDTDDNAEANKKAKKYLDRLAVELSKSGEIDKLTLSDTFALKFNITENDNNTGWIDNIKAVGSDGTDILVKAIINILLISVYKQRACRRNDDFHIHCMMDEIGKLADENIEGILRFANERNIFIVNSSPKAHRPLSYRRLYVLSKNDSARTVIQPILSTRQKIFDETDKIIG